MKNTIAIGTILISTLIQTQLSFAQAPELPLIQINALEYEGAFIIPGGEYGASNANYPAGTIAVNPELNSLYFAGFSLHGAVAEFAIPELVNSTVISDLNTAPVLQDFRAVLYDTADENPQSIDRISGLYLMGDQLIVNGVEYYDAPADNTHTTLVINDATDLAMSTVGGYYSIEGEAHASAWVSDIPAAWQPYLGGTQLAGNSSKYPINARLAIGISAFAIDATDLLEPGVSDLPSTALLDFNLDEPLYADYESYANGNYNLVELNGSTFPGHTVEDADIIVGANDLWTEISQASYGFIIPGTNTYMCLGSSGGHNSGIGYKPTQDNGVLCGGPCPYEADDLYNYYWLWDVNDLLAVKNATMLAYDVRPYAYGELDLPFQYDLYYDAPEFHPIIGATYDSLNNMLYITLNDAGSTGPYDVVPVIAAYSLNLGHCAGDLNQDGVVNIDDFLVLNSAFGTACDACVADITGDGLVNIEDFVAFNSQFGTLCE